MSYINPVNKPQCLQMLCEDSFSRLLAIFPRLKEPLQNHSCLVSKKAHLQLLDVSPYTLSFTLQSLDSSNKPVNPTIRCRFYLDSKSVEVTHVEGFIASLTQFKHDKPRTVLDKKWVLNYFLDQWLDFQSSPANQVSAPTATLSA